MSKKLFILPALLLGAMLTFTTSCGDADPCKDVDCGANGTCFEGSCVCDQGYELDLNGQCGDLWQTKFIGTYNTSETCVPAASGNFSNSISAGSDVTKIVISNFGDSGLNMVANLTSSTELTIPATSLSLGGTTYEVAGSGTISGTTITITYTIKEAGVLQFTCTDVLVKV